MTPIFGVVIKIRVVGYKDVDHTEYPKRNPGGKVFAKKSTVLVLCSDNGVLKDWQTEKFCGE